MTLALSSALQIPAEANRLDVTADGHYKSYELGTSPFHQWPVYLPLVTGSSVRTRSVTLRLELKHQSEGDTRLVGLRELIVELPEGGVAAESAVEIPRASASNDDAGVRDGGTARDAGVDGGVVTVEPISCNVAFPECPAGRICSIDGTGSDFICLLPCSTSADCPHDGWSCEDGPIDGQGCFCWEPCQRDFDCQVFGGGRCINECCSS